MTAGIVAGDTIVTINGQQSTAFDRVPPVGTLNLADIHWHAPIPRPLKNIVCLGLNYASHVRETTKADRAMKVPEIPVFFTKASTSVNGPRDPIPWDRSVITQVDYEISWRSAGNQAAASGISSGN